MLIFERLSTRTNLRKIILLYYELKKNICGLFVCTDLELFPDKLMNKNRSDGEWFLKCDVSHISVPY